MEIYIQYAYFIKKIYALKKHMPYRFGNSCDCGRNVDYEKYASFINDTRN